MSEQTSQADDPREAGYAIAASFDRRNRRISVVLNSGVVIQIPTRIIQGLSDAKPKDLAEIVITPSGLALHWPRLDAELYVPALLQDVTGTRKWMA